MEPFKSTCGVCKREIVIKAGQSPTNECACIEVVVGECYSLVYHRGKYEVEYVTGECLKKTPKTYTIKCLVKSCGMYDKDVRVFRKDIIEIKKV